MVPLLGCSVFGLAVIVERYRYLKEIGTDSGALRGKVRDLLRARNLDGALECIRASTGPVAEILRVGVEKLRFLINLGRPLDLVEPAVEKAMEEHSGHVVTQLEQNMSILMTVINVAPLLVVWETGKVVGQPRKAPSRTEATA